MPIAKKAVRPKRAGVTEPAPEPNPMPPAPPGPSGSLLKNLHGTAALSLLLLITAVVFLALSLGLSIFNTIEISRVKDTVKFVERLESKQVNAMGAPPAEAALPTSQDPEAMMNRADELMTQAEALMKKASELESGSATGTAAQ